MIITNISHSSCCAAVLRVRSGVIGHVPVEQSLRGAASRLRDGGYKLGIERHLCRCDFLYRSSSWLQFVHLCLPQLRPLVHRKLRRNLLQRSWMSQLAGHGAAAALAACSRWAKVLGEAGGIALLTGPARYGGGVEAAAAAVVPAAMSGSVTVGVAVAAAGSPLLPVLGESAGPCALANCNTELAVVA